VLARGGKNLSELALVESRRLLAEDVLAGGECSDAKSRVGIGMRGYVDGVDVRGEEFVE
jgi:hypothetical protein